MPGRKRVVSGSIDGSIIIWNSTTQKRIKNFGGYNREVRKVLFISNTQFISVSWDRTIKLWNTKCNTAGYSVDLQGRGFDAI